MAADNGSEDMDLEAVDMDDAAAEEDAPWHDENMEKYSASIIGTRYDIDDEEKESQDELNIGVEIDPEKVVQAVGTAIKKVVECFTAVLGVSLVVEFKTDTCLKNAWMISIRGKTNVLREIGTDFSPVVEAEDSIFNLKGVKGCVSYAINGVEENRFFVAWSAHPKVSRNKGDMLAVGFVKLEQLNKVFSILSDQRNGEVQGHNMFITKYAKGKACTHPYCSNGVFTITAQFTTKLFQRMKTQEAHVIVDVARV